VAVSLSGSAEGPEEAILEMSINDKREINQ
jgi:hypothetical protein